MISNIKFGHAKTRNFVTKATTFYVYHNPSETALINSQREDWEFIEFDIAETLSHETLHKVLFKLEGSKASTMLDKWCKSRKWLYNDNTGMCFCSWDIEPDNPIYQKAKQNFSVNINRKGESENE